MNKETNQKNDAKNKNIKVKGTEKTVKKDASIKKDVKINYKKEYEKLQKENGKLKIKIQIIELAKMQEEEVFKEKAKSFQKDAQVKLEKVKAQLRKKAKDDHIEVQKYGGQKLFESIIDTITNLEMAIESGKNQEDPAVKAYVVGFEMLITQINQAFADNGIKEIKPKVGEAFNPELHNIISKTGNRNIIVEVKKKGFKLHDRVIKPADVIIK